MKKVYIICNSVPFDSLKVLRAPSLRVKQLTDLFNSIGLEILYIYDSKKISNEEKIIINRNNIMLSQNLDLSRQLLESIKDSLVVFTQDVYIDYLNILKKKNTIIFDYLAEKYTEILIKKGELHAKQTKKNFIFLLKNSNIVLSNVSSSSTSFQDKSDHKFKLINLPFMVPQHKNLTFNMSYKCKKIATLYLGRHSWNQDFDNFRLLNNTINLGFEYIYIIDPKSIIDELNYSFRLKLQKKQNISIITTAPYSLIDNILIKSNFYIYFEKENLERVVSTPAHVLHALSNGCIVCGSKLPVIERLNLKNFNAFTNLEELFLMIKNVMGNKIESKDYINAYELLYRTALNNCFKELLSAI